MPLDIRVRFGRAVRRLREEQEINQEEAAQRRGTRDQKRVTREYRENREGTEEEPA
jgi:hypothetical protein